MKNDTSPIQYELNCAFMLAVTAHAGQVDKNGMPFVWHPIRVALKLSEPDRVVALLHDAVEDSTMDFQDLLNLGISFEAVEVIKVLTHEDSVSYDDYVEHVAKNPQAVRVKVADLLDNLSESRRYKGDEQTREEHKKALLRLTGCTWEDYVRGD